jgi:hypothetical protein
VYLISLGWSSCIRLWTHQLQSMPSNWLLRLWVRIPPGAWMFVCCECCVLSSRGLCDELITRPEESYRLWCLVWSRNLKNEEGTARRAIEKKKPSNTTLKCHTTMCYMFWAIRTIIWHLLYMFQNVSTLTSRKFFVSEIALICDYLFINWQHTYSILVRSLMKNLHVAKVLETCSTFFYGIKSVAFDGKLLYFKVLNTMEWIVIKFCEYCNELLSLIKSELPGSLKDQFVKMGTWSMVLIRAIKIFVARQNYSRTWSPKCIIIKPNQNKLLSTFQCITKQHSYVCQLKANKKTVWHKLESELWTLSWYFVLISISQNCEW